MIQLNNREMEHEEGMTVKSLIRKKRYTHPMLIVRINGRYIPEDDYDEAIIHDGDDVKILHPVAGG